MIWRGEREWSFTACGQRRWTESFPMDAILLQLHFCSLQWISINGHSYKHLFSLAHSLALLHGVGFVPATLYLQQLWWMKDSDSQPPFLHLGYTTTFWANTVSFSDPHKYQQVTWNQSCFCSDLIPSTARRGFAEVFWTALQIENASASTPQKNLRSWLLMQQIWRYIQQQHRTKKSCEGQGGSWEKKTQTA